MPISGEVILSLIRLSHAEAINGVRPSSRAGTTNSIVQESSSLAGLISANKLPASASMRAAFGAGGVVLDVAVAWISGFRGLTRWTCEPGRWALPVQGRPGMLNGCAAPLAPCGSGLWIGLSPR